MIPFGPVPSRRFGKSLGINNLSTVKTCTYSCIYCQLGRTKNLCATRRSFYSPETFSRNVSNHMNKVKSKNDPDCITIVPDGEPTLDIKLNEEIRLLKKFNLPVNIITNGSLLFDKEVREAVNLADQVCVKVDTLQQKTWKKINRPSKFIDFHQYLNGVQAFSQSYKGQLYTETMLVDSLNDAQNELIPTAAFLTQLKPATSFLLIPTRPHAERYVKAPQIFRLLEAQKIFFKYGLKTELLNEFEGDNIGITGNAYEDILSISAVHPIREDVMKKLLEKNNSDKQVLESLINEKLIRSVTHQGEKYYIRYYHI